MSPDDLLERFAIDPARLALPRGTPADPALATAGFTVELEEPKLLGGKNLDTIPQSRSIGDREPVPLSLLPRGLSPASWVMAMAVYFVTLLVLWPWDFASAVPTPPITVQLVLEQPSPPPPSLTPKPAEKKPPGNLTSLDVGDPLAKPQLQPAPATEQGSTERAQEKQLAMATPPPELTSALPKPTPEPEADLKPPEIPPLPQVKRALKQPVAVHVPRSHPLAHPGQVPGPAATHDEYLAYVTRLIAQHFDLLPVSLIGGRRGMTVLSILVLGDGTIARVAVSRSSGYPDIDARIEQMVAAVRRFPPLPQWFQGPAMPLGYALPFPEGLH